jgi:hypothetical protein
MNTKPKPAGPACDYVIDGCWRRQKRGKGRGSWRPYIEAHRCDRRPATPVNPNYCLCAKHLVVERRRTEQVIIVARTNLRKLQLAQRRR